MNAEHNPSPKNPEPAENTATNENTGANAETVPGPSWSDSHEWDSGSETSVALRNNGVLTEIHKSQGNTGIWNKLGLISNGSVTKYDAHKHDSGYAPRIAVNNNGRVVQVHNNILGAAGKLYYRVGTINDDSTDIEWGDSHHYDSGQYADVSINDHGQIVEVHADQWLSNVWYHAGTINADNTISWGSAIKLDSGTAPAIALNNNGDVVEIHVSPGKDDMWYNVGRINGTQINWMRSISTKFDDGYWPAIDMNNHGQVYEVHNSLAIASDYWGRPGVLTANGMNWGNASKITTNVYPLNGVAINDNGALITTYAGSITKIKYRTAQWAH